jgi:hypothetical protein
LAEAVVDNAAALPTESAAVRAATAKADEAERTAQAVRTALTKPKSDLRACEVEVHLADAGVMIAVNTLLAPEISNGLSCAPRGRGSAGAGSGKRRQPEFIFAELNWQSRVASERARPPDTITKVI